MRRCGALRLYFHNIYIYTYTYIIIYIILYLRSTYITCMYLLLAVFSRSRVSRQLDVSMLVMADLEAFSCHIAETS
jgi:hypothetical protein